MPSPSVVTTIGMVALQPFRAAPRRFDSRLRSLALGN